MSCTMTRLVFCPCSVDGMNCCVHRHQDLRDSSAIKHVSCNIESSLRAEVLIPFELFRDGEETKRTGGRWRRDGPAGSQGTRYVQHVSSITINKIQTGINQDHKHHVFSLEARSHYAKVTSTQTEIFIFKCRFFHWRDMFGYLRQGVTEVYDYMIQGGTLLQETDNRGKKSDPAVPMSLLCHRGRGFIIKLRNWSTSKNTNPFGIPACG